MNDNALVAMFLFSALEGQVAKYESTPAHYAGIILPVYESCGMGAVEVARSLGSIVAEMLDKFDPERPFCDLLYTDCDAVAEALYKFMREHKFMPTSLYALEL